MITVPGRLSQNRSVLQTLPWLRVRGRGIALYLQHISRPMGAHQQHINAARPAADIHDTLAREVHALKQPRHFRRPARGQPAITPNAFRTPII